MVSGSNPYVKRALQTSNTCSNYQLAVNSPQQWTLSNSDLFCFASGMEKMMDLCNMKHFRNLSKLQ